ncbi:SigE family RNA polymerase sigma factor [Catenulispora subtropica]|uniref:SigE family RNA polymerase sigma factor n=1 Tax=Catenulispora subtropica TaxID=450798 RepID=A0ABP5CVP2_9ACTN
MEPGFAEFVASRAAALFRTAVLIVGDRHAAEDLVQSALERTYRHWGRVSAMETPEPYVRRILANLAVDHFRAVNRRPVRLLDHDGVAPDHSPDVDEHDAVIRVLRELPPRMRAVLVLRYFDDLTEAQVAEVLGIAVGTVKSQAARGLAKLREAMASQEQEERTA